MSSISHLIKQIPEKTHTAMHSFLKFRLNSITRILKRHYSGRQCPRPSSFPCIRLCPQKAKGAKVVICGATNTMSHYMAMLLKQSPLIKQIALYGVNDPTGIAADLNHITSRCRVKSYRGPLELRYALQDANVVLIAGGREWRPGMSSEILFNMNVRRVRSLAEATALYCPEAVIGVITGPINCFVPLINEVYKVACCYNPDRVIGMMTHHVARANSIVASANYLDPTSVDVPFLGGASAQTFVPVLSQAQPLGNFSVDMIKSMTLMIQKAEHNMFTSSGMCPVLSPAASAARFALALVCGVSGKEDVSLTAFVRTNAFPNYKYFAHKVQLGPEGVCMNHGIPKLSEYETALLVKKAPQIEKDVLIAECFMEKNSALSQCKVYEPSANCCCE